MSGEGSGRVIVVPGDKLPDEVEAKEPYVVEVGGSKYATVMGILDLHDDKANFIPLQSVYIPKPGDIVIGMVQSIGVMNWQVDINSPYVAVLNAQDFLGRPFNPLSDDLTQYLNVGDYLKAKVVAFDRSRSPLLTVQDKGLGKIVDGKIVEIQAAKIPRVIGKKRSMLNMLQEETGCDVFVAVNGRIHVKCSDPDREAILVLAIKMIEREAHTTGLTARVQEYIQELKKVRGVE
ncbi:MAG: exosome complex RNA-binding protein Rrp4 [Desulfurococcales archaeon]|nr:exosome complex RNA-binding protein Rrp4 [Desulfurococcales archaeon]